MGYSPAQSAVLLSFVSRKGEGRDSSHPNFWDLATSDSSVPINFIPLPSQKSNTAGTLQDWGRPEPRRIRKIKIAKSEQEIGKEREKKRTQIFDDLLTKRSSSQRPLLPLQLAFCTISSLLTLFLPCFLNTFISSLLYSLHSPR